MFSRRHLVLVALLALAVLAVLALRPGHGGPAAQAHDSDALDHPHLAMVTRRHSAATHARALLALQSSHIPANSHWLASWGAAPEAPSPSRSFALAGFANQTVREIVMLSSSGAAIRIHLTNVYGDRPLVIGRASVALAGVSGALDGTAHGLSFGGVPEVSIPPGGAVVSDPVVMSVRPLQRLAVSLYLPEATGPVTYHGSAEQLAFIGAGDDVLDRTAGWTGESSTSWYALSSVDTLSTSRYAGTVAAMGDSITAGFRSNLNSFGAWPDDLARRLAQVPGTTLGVIDEGISGNRLLNPSPCCGPSGLSRLSVDVLDQAGVRDVILLEGVNDIGFSQDHSALTEPHTNVSAAEIIAGDEQAITAAHQAGVRIYGATLLPFKGARYWTAAGEAKREAVNHWILTSGAFDGVINFAAVMADPGHPEVLNPAYDSGDHLHPSNVGYAAMANAVNLTMLTARVAPARGQPGRVKTSKQATRHARPAATVRNHSAALS